MKQTTQQWLKYAEIDILACEKIIDDDFLTSIIAYHSQQSVEKCFKAIIEENSLEIPRIHNLTRLFAIIKDYVSFTIDTDILQILDSIYITSRYPSDLGLFPDGKPSQELTQKIFLFAKYILENTNQQLQK